MANPTTNFGWQMPEPTDLVTDLPADFEVFGQAVDTDFVDLLGGTTGQVLSKTSNTDLDFTWVAANPGDITGVTAGTGISGGGTSGTVTVTNSMATAIDAKGDLIAGTGADAFSILAVGTNGYLLTADSSEATGIKWAASAGGGGMTLLSTTSLSGTTTISSISQSYKNLYIVAKAMQSTNNNISFYAQFNGSTASDYTWGTYGASISGVAFIGSSAATNLFPVGHSNGTSGFANQNQFIMEIPRYTETENRFYTVTYYGAEDTNNGSRRAVYVNSLYADTAAITSLTILASGNAAYTGTLYIYGVN